MSNHHSISENFLSINEAIQLLTDHTKLNITEDSKNKIETCRKYLDDRLAKGEETFYGINTGFGSLCNVKIPLNDIEQLQYNLVVSHACGIGKAIPKQIVKLMLLLKAKNLSYGHSAASITVVQRLVDMFNENVLPVIYKYGSLGASGDLAPLAHLSLPIIGEGKVWFNGKEQDSKTVLEELDWSVIKLQSKEGLALLNGTQFMSAYGTWCVNEAYKLYQLADFITALSMDAYHAKTSSLNFLIHKVRNQAGQKTSAKAISKFLEGSEIASLEKEQIQDPYSFRCAPQVNGASLDVIDQVKRIVENEINAVTDNPLIFPEENEILSGGNFHGQPLALHLDFLKLAVAELANISERRTFKLLNGVNGLPEFLVNEPGLNSGLMIPQYAAASLVSANKQLCTPASIDSITSSNGQEDHVSMGANAATQCYDIIENCKQILAIEFLTASQALGFRRPLKSSPIIESTIAEYVKVVPFNATDRLLHNDIKVTAQFISKLNFDEFYFDN